MWDLDADAEFLNDIAPNVLSTLEKGHFFERLDDRFCPADPSADRVKCGHSFAHSENILRDLGMSSDDMDDVLAVLKSRGGCCDCEVLYNVVEESRLKDRYWKARASGLAEEEDELDQRKTNP